MEMVVQISGQWVDNSMACDSFHGNQNIFLRLSVVRFFKKPPIFYPETTAREAHPSGCGFFRFRDGHLAVPLKRP